MNLRYIVFHFCLLLFSATVISQNAPVTTAGSAYTHASTVTIPVTVTNFTGIGAISLTLDYDHSVVQFDHGIPNSQLSSMIITDNDLGTGYHRLIMGWYGLSGVTLPDNAHLVDITFTGLVAGQTNLTWIDNGTSCEYAKFDNGAYDVLNDSPTGNYYKNGQIIYQRNGPITVAPVYTAAPHQVICIPIKVYQFSNIGSISLTMDYDPSVLTFQGINSSTIPNTWIFDGQAVNPGRLIVGGFGPGIASLPDGAILFNACFYYHSGTSLLAWYDATGSSCEYADAATLNPLYDLPQNVFYIDGVVTAPLTADFSADNTTPPRNTTVTFTDHTTGGPTSWDWSFDRPADVVYVTGNSHSQNPQVQFTEGGPYTVTLTVHNAYLTDSKVRVAYIWAGIPGLWSGETSTDWNITTNWDNWNVPGNLIDVLIPAAAPYWPIYSGDLTIGTQCKTITLQALTSQMTVTGHLIIPSKREEMNCSRQLACRRQVGSLPAVGRSAACLP